MKKKKVFDLTVKITLNAIRKFAKKSKGKEVDFQILDILMPQERRIRSIVGGLETSLGTTLWVPLIKEIASLNGFEVCNERALLKPARMPTGLETTLNRIISSRENPGSIYNAKTSRDKIKRACASLKNNPINRFRKPPPGKGVDIWLKKNGINYLSDSKTVQPNVGSYKDFLKQILTWYAYYYSKFPSGEARGFIFIPYNPYVKKDFLEKTPNHGYPLLKKELWVQDDLWDFCSGIKNTFQIILSAVKHINKKKLVQKELNKLFRSSK